MTAPQRFPHAASILARAVPRRCAPAAALLLAAALAAAACSPAPKYRAGSLPEVPGAAAAEGAGAPEALPFALSPPVKRWSCSRITSPFGSRGADGGAGRMHEGIDIDTESGEEVYAAAEGRVSFAGRRRGYGTAVVIDHEGNITTTYGHLAYLTVRRGDRVSAGSRIGRAGKRGRVTGTHLHFELRRGRRPMDPRPYLCLDSAPRSP